MPAAFDGVYVSRIVEELRAPDGGAELAPQLFAGDRESQVACTGVKRLIWNDNRIGSAHRLRNLAVGKVVRDRGSEQGELAFQHRDVDLLPLSGFLLDP